MGTGWFGSGSAARKIAVVAGTVVALALVILGMAAISEPAKKGDAPTVELSALDEAERLAQDASAALTDEDTATAVELAQRALATDPDNATAQRVMDATKDAEKKPAADPSTPDIAPGVYASVVKDIGLLLPAKVRDWTPGRQVVEKGEGLVTFEPEAGSDDAQSSVRVLIMSHDRGSAAAATKFITSVTRKAFSTAGKTVAVGAVGGGYTGTDASHQSVVAFARGRYAFEVIVTPQPGATDATARATALDIAKRLPAAAR